MECPLCHKEVNQVTAIYREGQGKIAEGCRDCTSGIITPLVNYRLTNDTHGFTIGAAHLDDIKHRRIDGKTGQVYRNTNKKIFC